ncbi:elongation factor 1-beta [Candidatus Woesearchaeota archaeon]|jgi:elongation factor 1-beta|nr:elongation factor 1-beta [Candidatus Woesearchaeota archaeon]MBT4150855.1 elongation factor 1-beta [Candidatus Woesearchaeota archaeon]MBT4246960.1 elongation factor 1-beta [Candidatus Woesearchaeota archaeon]MBT4433645.1 elongation factor 1-beta [Candidatus Woesearchaeota archaeon]
MGKAVVTFKIMPEGVEVDLGPIKEKAEKIARDAGAIGQMQVKEDPIAFGLKAVLVLGMYEVEGSDFEKVAEEMQKIEHVQSAEIAKMDLALG